MKAVDWLTPAATVLAALIMITPLVFGSQRPDPEEPDRRTSHPGRWWALSAVSAVIAAVIGGLALPPWGWLVPTGVSLTTAAAIIVITSVLKRLRTPPIDPATQQFLQHRDAAFGGFVYDRDALPDLVVVYTEHDLSDTNRFSGQDPTGQQAKESVSQHRRTFAEVAVDPAYLHLAITGDAGIGKTSLLEFWNHELAWRPGAVKRDTPLKRMVPLLTSARNLVGKKHVAEAFGDQGESLLSTPPGPGLQWLVMIDAFDEITGADERAAVERVVFAAIDEASSAGGPVKYVITTRGLTDDRWRSFDSRGVTEFRLQPFTTEQLRAFLVRRETSTRDRGDDSAAREAAERKADRFLNRWKAADNLLELLRLPLLARVAASIYFDDEQAAGIPARRVDIYRDAVEHWISQFSKRLSHGRDGSTSLRLLTAWGGDNGLPDAESAVRALLERLAVLHLEDPDRSIAKAACEILEVSLHPRQPRHWDAVKTLLEATGLIHDVNTERPRFLHKTFAEFLAAATNASRLQDVGDWTAGLTDPERRVATVFAFDRLAAERRQGLIGAILADPAQAVTCGWIAAEGLCITSDHGQVDDALRARLIDRCVDAIPRSAHGPWWPVIAMLAGVDAARTRLEGFITERRAEDTTLARIAAEVAKHHPGAVVLLQVLAADRAVDPFARVTAAYELAEHHKGVGIGMLNGFAISTSLPQFLRVLAAERLVRHDRQSGLALLREYACGAKFGLWQRINAAGFLAEHDREAGLLLLTEFVTNPVYTGYERIAAAREYLKYHREDGIRLIRRSATDPFLDDGVRVNAAGALVTFDRESGLRLLVELIENEAASGYSRINAAGSLCEHDQASGTIWLTQFVDERSFQPSARAYAAHVLELRSPGKGLPRLREFVNDPTLNDHERIQVAQYLANHDRRVGIDLCLRYLVEDGLDPYARITLLDMLAAETSDEGIPKLHEMALDSDIDYHSRIRAAERLVEYEFDAGTQVLRSIAADPSLPPWERTDALTYLAKYDREGTRAALNRISMDSSSRWLDRTRAIEALAAVDLETALTRLRAISTEQHAPGSVRLIAIRRLAQFDRTGVLEILGALATSPAESGYTRAGAASQMAEFGAAEGVELLRGLLSDPSLPDSCGVQAAWHLLSHDAETAAASLRKRIADPATDDSDRCEAAAHLASHDREVGLSALNSLATDTRVDEDDRVRAVQRLSRFDRRKAIELAGLLAAEASLNLSARIEAARVLASVDRGTGLPLLRSLASAEGLNDTERFDVAAALTGFDRNLACRLLRELAKDLDAKDTTRVDAAGRLEDLDWPECFGLLCDFALDKGIDDQARVAAVSRIIDFDPSRLPDLRILATDSEIEVFARIGAAAQLAAFDRVEGLELLRCYAVAPELGSAARARAASQLAWHERLEGVQLLSELAQDTSVDSLQRVNIMRWLTWHDRKGGLSLLRSATSDETGPTATAWAAFALAEWSEDEAVEIMDAQKSDPDLDLEALASAAADLREHHPSAADRAEQWIDRLRP
ncbi:hypothetical protein ACFQS3_24825 [Glycomyces mayteni]|uniref:NACHT domain-containing protein n=1 Tax=Glycomyces mayteni TaxID=543887 RepID=A0ABW2DFX5_9ACTN